jgi:predicted homoserine dehydrogenase-like protein
MQGITDCMHGRSLLQPDFGFRTNVFAYAKRDLNVGEKLDGIGGFTCYGQIENVTPTSTKGLPICLAEDVVLKRTIRKDERIALGDVIYDSTRRDFELFFKACLA